MEELVRTTVGDLVDQVASRFPDREALVDIPAGRRYTYRELVRTVDALAGGLLKIGIGRGEHLALWTPNLAEYIITEFAAAKIGAVLVSVDTNARAEQLEYLLRQSDSRTLVLSGREGSPQLETFRRLCPGAGTAETGWQACASLPELKRLIVIAERPLPGMITWDEVRESGWNLPSGRLAERQAACRPDDVVTLLYTSGTTGAPKGVMSTHVGIVNTTLASAENQHLTPEDRLCLSVPLAHMFGCVCVTLAAAVTGAAIVIPAPAFDARKILAAIAAERCTALYGSPASFIALMEDPDYRRFDLGSLRTGIMGGAQCPLEVMKRVVEEMGVREVVIGYGQTEASSWVTMTRPDDPLELRVSTVGRPLANVEVKLIDPASGREVPPGAVGEICVRGLNMKGYYKMPAATANAIDAEGWLHTGDLATMDPAGYVRTTGRLKEVILRGEETIYPAEVEEVLFSHPQIATAQVFGVPGGAAGEDLAAWIRLEEGAAATEEEIRRFCRENLPASRQPCYIKFVTEFPMTPLGKVQKFRLREAAIQEYGLA
ncbi:MAG: AMP-binding protein [Syntrophales bacterium]